MLLVLAALLPAIVTIVLPRWLLLLWIPALIFAANWLLTEVDTLDGPTALGAMAVAGILFLFNIPALLGRLIFVAARIADDSQRGY